MSDEDNNYQKLLPINSPYQNTIEDTDKISTSNYSLTLLRNLSTSQISSETTKSELIQRILDSFKPTLNSSDSTINTSLSFSDQTIIPCQSLNLTNKIYLNFQNENELGVQPTTEDILEKIQSNQKCSCHQIEINFDSHILNQQLSYKQKQSILRIILRRQQIFNRYFS